MLYAKQKTKCAALVGGEHISHRGIKIESGEVACRKGNILAKVTAASCRPGAQHRQAGSTDVYVFSPLGAVEVEPGVATLEPAQ